MKIGLIADSLRLPFDESIVAAQKLGVTGVQKYMTYGNFSATELNTEKVKEIRDIMSSNGLIFSAICGDFGLDLDDDTIVDRSKRVLERQRN